MKIIYNPDLDGLRILFSDAPIEHSATVDAGLTLDYDQSGGVVGLEVAQASHCMSNPRLVEFTERSSAPDDKEPEP